MIILQHRIYRQDLRNNPGVLYVFGDNDQRKGMGGQAKEMRGEPNAVGVRTKWKPTMEEDAFYRDANFTLQRSLLEEDLDRLDKHLKREGIVVMPSDGLGTGLSQLPTRSPRFYQHLMNEISNLGL